MPAAHLVLYAKWAPVQHDVRFFRTYDDMLAYEAGDTSVEVLHDLKVDHGALAEGVVTPEDTSGHDYVFGGWFYMKSHKKTAYTPLDMPIVRNMNVFADWGTHSAQPFIIHYVTLEAETDAAWTAAARAAALYNPRDNTAYTASSGGETRRYVYLAEDGGFHRTVADDSVGYAFQGTTRTFIPKAGAPLNQLYDDYNRGYYPTLASHSATIQYEGDKSDPTANVFTFTYVHAENIGYTVEYRYLSDDRLIPDAPRGGTVEKTTQMTVVTERFAVIANYMPDAFYKRLVLAVEKDENGKYVGSKDNVVTFYYTPDVQNAYYAVHHMLQDLDAVGDALTPEQIPGEVPAQLDGAADHHADAQRPSDPRHAALRHDEQHHAQHTEQRRYHDIPRFHSPQRPCGPRFTHRLASPPAPRRLAFHGTVYLASPVFDTGRKRRCPKTGHLCVSV